MRLLIALAMPRELETSAAEVRSTKLKSREVRIIGDWPQPRIEHDVLSARCETFDLAENYHDGRDRRDGLSIRVKRRFEPPTLHGFNGFLIEV
jgi:hypothetical protein